MDAISQWQCEFFPEVVVCRGAAPSPAREYHSLDPGYRPLPAASPRGGAAGFFKRIPLRPSHAQFAQG